MHFVRSLRHAGAGHQRPSGHLALIRVPVVGPGDFETDFLGNVDKNLMNLLDPLERKAKKNPLLNSCKN